MFEGMRELNITDVGEYMKVAEESELIEVIESAEEFKDVKGYEGIYKVSNLGRVKNSKDKLLKPSPNRGGYYLVNLFKDGKAKSYYIHDLVAEHFLSEPSGYNPDGTPFRSRPEIDHIDSTKSNNRASNLRWVDRYFNVGRITPTEGTKRAGVPILSISKDGKQQQWRTITSCAQALGLDTPNICAVLAGKLKTTGGYRFYRL